jgi:hypothetical protein
MAPNEVAQRVQQRGCPSRRPNTWRGAMGWGAQIDARVVGHQTGYAVHLDTAYYDTHFQPGAYLPTHSQHWARWHPHDGS